MSDYQALPDDKSQSFIQSDNSQNSIPGFSYPDNSQQPVANYGFQTLVVPNYPVSKPVDVIDAIVTADGRVLTTIEEKSAALYTIKTTLNSTKEKDMKSLFVAFAASMLYTFLVVGNYGFGYTYDTYFGTRSTQTAFILPYLVFVGIGFFFGTLARKNESSTLGIIFSFFSLANLMVQLGIVGTLFFTNNNDISVQVGFSASLIIGALSMLRSLEQTKIYELKDKLSADLKK